MKKVTIYSTKICPYCVRAKMLLQHKHIPFEEIDISNDEPMRTHMVEQSGGRSSVPQIFIGDHHIGGFDDLYALNQQGKLDALLASEE